MENKIIAIHQPNYIPWLGYFYKIYKSDVFVFHDDTKFSESGMHNYHYIKTPQGKFRLKIPVEKLGLNINQIRTRDELKWKEKHLQNILHNYKKARYFDEIYTDYKSIISIDYENLAQMNQEIIIFYCKKLGIKTEFILSSSLKLTSTKQEKIIDTCKKINGNTYYSGTGAQAYQDEGFFRSNGIQLLYTKYKPFKYFQLWGAFEPNVTIIDFFMYNGYNLEKILENEV